MKAILAIVTLLGLATATTVYAAQRTSPATENPDQATVQERDPVQDRTSVLTQSEHRATIQNQDRTRTPGSEPGAEPQQGPNRMEERDRIRTPGSEPGVPQQDQDTMQKRDRIHTPGTAQPGSRPRTPAPNPGSGSRGGGGRRR